MPIPQKIKDVATKAKSFVNTHKQTIFNTVMFVGLAGVSAAVVVLTRTQDEIIDVTADNDSMLMRRQDYARERIYDVERHVGMPVNSDDQRHHDYLQSLEADPDKQ
jgi:hypothetical protein